MNCAASMRKLALRAFALCLLALPMSAATGHGQGGSAKPPNILVIMGDDVGLFNIGAYHRGMMVGKTPNLDKMAAAGMMFTDYTPRRAVQRVAPTSSLARSHSA